MKEERTRRKVLTIAEKAISFSEKNSVNVRPVFQGLADDISVMEIARENIERIKSGVPVEYRPEFCGLVINVLTKGYGNDALPGYLGVSKSRIQKWASEHEDFADAMEIGSSLRAMETYRQLEDMRSTNRGNAYLMAMKANAFTEIKAETNKLPEKAQEKIEITPVIQKVEAVAAESKEITIDIPLGY
jgi:hypothetical protein